MADPDSLNEPDALAPLLDLRVPLTVRRVSDGRALLTAPVPESLARLRATVQYGGDELVVPHLCYETIEHADLRGADLRGLFLYNAVFAHVRLEGADFTGARLRDTAFLDCADLGRAVGLDRAEHDGPSCLDARTLRACAASLPDVFLAGAGFTGEEVRAWHGLSAARRPRPR